MLARILPTGSFAATHCVRATTAPPSFSKTLRHISVARCLGSPLPATAGRSLATSASASGGGAAAAADPKAAPRLSREEAVAKRLGLTGTPASDAASQTPRGTLVPEDFGRYKQLMVKRARAEFPPPAEPLPEVAPQELVRLLYVKKDNADTQTFSTSSATKIVDVREAWECEMAPWNDKRLVHLPLSMFWSGAFSFPTASRAPLVARAVSENKDEHVVVLCQQGVRSALVVQLLQSLGFSNVWNIQGGMTAVGKLLPKELTEPDVVP